MSLVRLGQDVFKSHVGGGGGGGGGRGGGGGGGAVPVISVLTWNLSSHNHSDRHQTLIHHHVTLSHDSVT